MLPQVRTTNLPPVEAHLVSHSSSQLYNNIHPATGLVLAVLLLYVVSPYCFYDSASIPQLLQHNHHRKRQQKKMKFEVQRI